MAFEFLELNGLSPSGVAAKICDLQNPGSAYDDTSLCPVGSDTPRKYVNVETELQVNFAFLPIIGWGSTIIRANSTSEAASVDLGPGIGRLGLDVLQPVQRRPRQ